MQYGKKNAIFAFATLSTILLLVLIDLDFNNLFNNTENTSNMIDNPINSTQNQNTEINIMKISITVNDKILTATMIDSKATIDFISLLPLQLTLEDYAGTEK